VANHGEKLIGPFGRLEVVKRDGGYHWVTCTCRPAPERKPFKVRNDHLKSGNTKSCGCLRVEAGRASKNRKSADAERAADGREVA
jgi:hypothetical protein